MTAHPYTSSNKDCEDFLKAGGTFEALGGNLVVGYAPAFERYVLINTTGNGGKYVQPSFSQMQSLMEQLTGGLEPWAGVEGE